MNINNAIEVLKENILDQAIYYLENVDEFFPFGASIDKNDDINPVSFYIEEDHPSTVEVLKKLEKALMDRIEKYDYQYAAIGVDIYKNANTPKGIVKKNALEIRFYSKETSLKKYYFFYFKKDTNYFFEESLDIS